MLLDWNEYLVNFQRLVRDEMEKKETKKKVSVILIFADEQGCFKKDF